MTIQNLIGGFLFVDLMAIIGFVSVVVASTPPEWTYRESFDHDINALKARPIAGYFFYACIGFGITVALVSLNIFFRSVTS